MAPVKFADIPKLATEVLNDDYRITGFELKTKQKTSFNGTSATTTLDLWPAKDGNQCMVKTVSWSLPKPLGIAGFAINKLEMDKAGKFKLEASADKAVHSVDNLKLEARSDLVSADSLVAGFTFTGLPEAMVKFETKPTLPKEFTCEVTKAMGALTFGAKFGMASLLAPDLGVRYSSGPFFAAAMAKSNFGAFTFCGTYKVNNELKLAASMDQGGKTSGSFAVGASYDGVKNARLKAKMMQDSVSGTVKYTVSEGFSVLCGGKYDIKKGNHTYGVALSLE
mmetsp:Transcript_45139/g.98125  ORF Transcript_45139/g.98125 Transcript_45139/m.98125 type:complete len:280 (-) Transcript_45139:99-938(-)